MNNTGFRYPALYQFMTCYYMQNYDIVYGDFENALDEYLKRESETLTTKLILEVEEIERKDLILDIVKPGSKASEFWKGLGGMRLVRRHLDILRQKIC